MGLSTDLTDYDEGKKIIKFFAHLESDISLFLE